MFPGFFSVRGADGPDSWSSPAVKSSKADVALRAHKIPDVVFEGAEGQKLTSFDGLVIYLSCLRATIHIRKSLKSSTAPTFLDSPFIAEPSCPTRLTRSVGSENRSECSMDFNASRNDAVCLVAVEECAVPEQTGSRGRSESGKI